MHLNIIKNIEDFKLQDNLLKDQKEYDHYKYVLSSVGGADYEKCIKLCMSRCMNNQAMSFMKVSIQKPTKVTPNLQGPEINLHISDPECVLKKAFVNFQNIDVSAPKEAIFNASKKASKPKRHRPKDIRSC